MAEWLRHQTLNLTCAGSIPVGSTKTKMNMEKIETTIENLEKYMSPNSPKFPIMYNGMLYNYNDCDKDFLDLYEGKFMLSSEGGIYMTDGMYMFPDGEFGEGML